MIDELIYEKKNDEGNLITVKSILTLEEFKEGIRIFCEPPYCEKLTDEDCRLEYDSYDKNGIALGCYVDGILAGLNCIVNEIHEDYSIRFDSNKVAYYSGLAVKGKYRKKGFGKLLIFETQKYLEKLKIYDYCYARILCKGSMSEGIFAKAGFVDAYDKSKLIVDEVEYDRNNPDVSNIDRRKYMVKSLNNRNGWFSK